MDGELPPGWVRNDDGTMRLPRSAGPTARGLTPAEAHDERAARIERVRDEAPRERDRRAAAEMLENMRGQRPRPDLRAVGDHDDGGGPGETRGPDAIGECLDGPGERVVMVFRSGPPPTLTIPDEVLTGRGYAGKVPVYELVPGGPDPATGRYLYLQSRDPAVVEREQAEHARRVGEAASQRRTDEQQAFMDFVNALQAREPGRVLQMRPRPDPLTSPEDPR